MVTESLLCAQEEALHAHLAFHLASSLAPPSSSLPSLIQATTYPPHTCSITGDVASLLTETIYEGCVEETLGALRAAKEAGREEEDPAFRQFWSRIAADEAYHASYAWRIVKVWREGGGKEKKGGKGREGGEEGGRGRREEEDPAFPFRSRIASCAWRIVKVWREGGGGGGACLPPVSVEDCCHASYAWEDCKGVEREGGEEREGAEEGEEGEEGEETDVFSGS
jgi:hypothetical protein